MNALPAFRPRLRLAFVLVVSLLTTPLASSAQCVLCSTQVEAARQEQDGYEPGGLNKGILYLMTIPYLLMGVVGYGWYHRRKRDRTTPALAQSSAQPAALARHPH